MKISVITVAYKNSKVVIDLLNSIAKYNDIGDDLEVIIVDNSPDELKIEDAIKVADYQNYIYIKKDNKGFGAGNNAGAEIAKGEILAFLNPDIILIEPIFKKIGEMFAADNQLGWVGGQLLGPNNTWRCSYGPMAEYEITWLDFLLPFRKKFKTYDEKTMWLHGADMFFRKTVFNQIGRFDEKIFMYWEEEELTHRMRKLAKDYKIKFCPEIRLIHMEQQSTPDVKYFYEGITIGKIICLKKHGIDYKKIFHKKYRFLQWLAFIFKFTNSQQYHQCKFEMQIMREFFKF